MVAVVAEAMAMAMDPVPPRPYHYHPPQVIKRKRIIPHPISTHRLWQVQVQVQQEPTHTHLRRSQRQPKKETKRRRKKPKDCPRRPLSAYNLFFKDERKRILNAIPGESEEMKKKKEEERPEITWPGKKKTPHRKIGFENLAKRIGQAWKDIDPEQLNYYKDLAVQDLQRYADEMKRYEKRLSFRKYCSESDEDEDSHSRHSPSHSRKEKRKSFNINTINDNDNDNNDRNKRRNESF
eukprot:188261_1